MDQRRNELNRACVFTVKRWQGQTRPLHENEIILGSVHDGDGSSAVRWNKRKVKLLCPDNVVLIRTVIPSFRSLTCKISICALCSVGILDNIIVQQQQQQQWVCKHHIIRTTKDPPYVLGHKFMRAFS